MSETPDEMTLVDIRQAIADYKSSAKLAKEAGFDGVQIQAGFVYLIQQFLHETTNQRTDAYGGNIASRARFLFDVLEAVVLWALEWEAAFLELEAEGFFVDTFKKAWAEFLVDIDGGCVDGASYVVMEVARDVGHLP